MISGDTMNTKYILIIVVVAVALGASYAFYRERESSPMIIRAGTLQGGISTLDIMQYYNLSEKYGYELQVYRFDKTTDIINALASGSIDVAVIPSEMAANMLLQNISVKIIAPEMLQNQAILTVKGNISAQELKGKTVATLLSTGTYMMFKAYMKYIYNITVSEQGKGNDTIYAINTLPGSFLDVMRENDIYAIIAWEPFVSEAVVNYNASIIADYQTFWKEANMSGEPVMLIWVASPSASNNKELINSFLKTREDAVNIWNGNENETISALMSIYNLNEKTAEYLYSRVTVLDNNLSQGVIDGIRSSWKLAWIGGYLTSDPSSIGDQVFYK
jgi:NitT/TauT family transport system substrate-binding protein